MTTKWPLVPLANVLTQDTAYITDLDPKDYPRISVKWWGEGAVAKGKVHGTQVRMEKHQLAKEGQVIVSEIWAKHGSIGIIPKSAEGALITSHFFLFDIDQNRILPKYLDYVFRANYLVSQMQEDSKGTTGYASVRPQTFLKAVIPLPEMPDQTRMVARIEHLAAKIAQAEELHRQTHQEREALRNSVANALFAPARLDQFPVHKLGDVADIQSGVTLGRAFAAPTLRLPYLRVANVQDGHLDLRKIKEVEVLETEAEKWLLQRGDVLLTEGGDWDKLGRGTVWAEEIPNCIHQNHIFRVRVDPNRFDPFFLAAYIGSPYGKLYFQQSAKKTTNLASINQRQLKAFRVFEPPLTTQQKMVRELADIERAVGEQKGLDRAVEAEMKALLPSILEKAFRGEL